MWPNPQFPAGLVTFTREILNGNLQFLCSVCDAFFQTETHFSISDTKTQLEIQKTDFLGYIASI